jgi:hypothetical protein
MEIENTRKRFKRRIEFERKIITIVNSIPDNDKPLNGLSDSAILVWVKSSSLSYKLELSGKISILSKDLMIFCDNSRNAFDVGKRINGSEMNAKIEQLRLFVQNKVVI